MQHPTAKVGNNCKIGPYVVLGPNVVIEDGVCLSKCTVLNGTHIKSHAWIQQAIIGWKCTIGRWVRDLLVTQHLKKKYPYDCYI